jgi:hypothetical protein
LFFHGASCVCLSAVEYGGTPVETARRIPNCLLRFRF